MISTVISRRERGIAWTIWNPRNPVSNFSYLNEFVLGVCHKLTFSDMVMYYYLYIFFRAPCRLFVPLLLKPCQMPFTSLLAPCLQKISFTMVLPWIATHISPHRLGDMLMLLWVPTVFNISLFVICLLYLFHCLGRIEVSQMTIGHLHDDVSLPLGTLSKDDDDGSENV